MWSLYNEMLDEYPLPTEMATSALLWFFGDIMAQKLEEKERTTRKENNNNNENHANNNNNNNNNNINNNNNLDWHRVIIQTIYAGFIWGIAGHYWYHWLDEHISNNNVVVVSSSSSILSSFSSENNSQIIIIIKNIIFVLSKLILEMILLHPISLFVFFVCVGLMNGETPTKIWGQLQTDFVTTLIMEYILWTPIDITNFALIPVQHQLLVVNITCLFESIMLSYIKHHGTTTTNTTKNEEEGGVGSILSSFLSIFFKNNNSNNNFNNKKNNKEEEEGERRRRIKKKTITRTNIKEE